MEDTLLEVRDLQVEFSTKMGIVRVLDKVNLKVDPRQTVGIIGESGCGKSMMALSIMGLVPIPPGRIAGGEILYCGTDLLTLEKRRHPRHPGQADRHDLSGAHEPPEPCVYRGQSARRDAAAARGHDKAGRVGQERRHAQGGGYPFPQKRMHDYSFQMSGGMRQRVMIAMSLCLDPDILIADEPTTALDVTVQAQDPRPRLREMQDRVGASIIMITHDLGVVAEVSDKVAVMYAGRKVEEGSVEQILFNPQHPYTKALKGCIPHLQRTPASGRHRLHEIPGMVLGMAELGQGPLFVLRALSVREAGMHGAQPARKGDRRRT